MKSKQITTQFIVLFVLLLSVFGGYVIGKAFPQSENDAFSDIPPLTKLDIPTQTLNGITADLESYYADGLRLIFAVRIIGNAELYFPDSVYIKDNSNQMINASYSFHAMEDDPAVYLIDAYLQNPLEEERFNGILEISVSPFSTEIQNVFSETVMFKFETILPLKPALTFNPNQIISVNKIEMLLEKIVISPAFTQMYLCYNKPSNADWMIGGSEFIVNFQTATLGTYTLLFDSEYGDTGKDIEPNWSPPIEEGRCVKLGSPIGSENPQSIELNILSLTQSMPEAIPEDELTMAREKLLAQGIDMDWQVFDYGNGGGGSGPVYNKLPAGMTEEEAYQAFMEALGYVHYGAWEFTINP